MLLAHYLPKVLTALFGGLFIFAGVYTFGNALLFDRIFIAILIFTAIICRKNVNVLGVVVILVLQRLLEEGAWFVSETEFQIFTKIGFYCIAAFAYYRMKYDPISKVLLVSFAVSVLSEFYWLSYGKNAPEIDWYIMALTVNLFTRHLIFMRVSYTEDYFPNRALSINLDWHIYKLNAVAACIQLIMILEYIVRSVLEYVQVVVFYTLYPYLMHAVATYAIWIIFHESYKLLIPKLLRA